MSAYSKQTGERIRMYRKMKSMTLQQLADRIHKSRASVSKYENGEIAMDIETLGEIARVLQVSPGQLLDVQEEQKLLQTPPSAYSGMSPFFCARRLYFYFYDGRYQRLKNGLIDIREEEDAPGNYHAALSIRSSNPYGQSSDIYYTGRVVFREIRFGFYFVNKFNYRVGELGDFFYTRGFRVATDGLLCGISSADLMPCAFRCLVTLTPQENTEELKKRLLITKEELQRWQRLNMLLVDNRGI